MIGRLSSSLTTKRAIFIILVLGMSVYFNSLFNGFVADDELQVTQNQLVHSTKNIPKFFFGSTFASGGAEFLQGIYYKPLMTSFYALLYTIFGANPFFFHLFQIFLHILNTILVFLLFKYFFGNFISLFLSMIFLTHPVNSESVLYISNLQEVLFFFFGMLALLVLSKLKSNQSVFLVSIFVFLSLLSKETGILFIPIILFFTFLYKRQFFKKFFIAALIVSSLYLILRFAAVGIRFNQDETFPMMQLTLSERLINAPKIVQYYLATFFYPKNLAISQHWIVKSPTLNDFYLPLLFIFVLFILFLIFTKSLIKERKDLFIISFMGAWFIIGVGFHLQIIPLDQTVADRWFYFPIAGLLGLMGAVIKNLKLGGERIKISAFLIGAIIILLFSTRTIIRSFDWRDGLTLYIHDTKILKDNFALENSLGYELFKIGELDESIYHLEKSNNLLPGWSVNLNNLGVAYSLRWGKNKRANDYIKAEGYYLVAIKNDRFFLSYENLAKLYISKNELKKAKQTIEESLKIYPKNSKLWLFLSDVEYKLGNQQAAIEAIEKSYILKPTEDKKEWYLFLKQNYR